MHSNDIQKNDIKKERPEGTNNLYIKNLYNIKNMKKNFRTSGKPYKLNNKSIDIYKNIRRKKIIWLKKSKKKL